MNDDQLDGFLSEFKSNGADAKPADLVLEQRLLHKQRSMSMYRRRTKFAVALAAVVFLGGAGFVLAGGESILIPQTASSGEPGEWREGPILRHVHQFLRHIHDHFAPHGHDQMKSELHSYDEADEAK